MTLLHYFNNKNGPSVTNLRCKLYLHCRARCGPRRSAAEHRTLYAYYSSTVAPNKRAACSRTAGVTRGAPLQGEAVEKTLVRALAQRSGHGQGSHPLLLPDAAGAGGTAPATASTPPRQAERRRCCGPWRRVLCSFLQDKRPRGVIPLHPGKFTLISTVRRGGGGEKRSQAARPTTAAGPYSRNLASSRSAACNIAGGSDGQAKSQNPEIFCGRVEDSHQTRPHDRSTVDAGWCRR